MSVIIGTCIKTPERTMDKLFATFTILVLISLVVHITEAGETKKDMPRKCWQGWATGTDIMKTDRNTTKVNCTEEQKTCMKWYLKQGKNINGKNDLLSR